MELSATVLNKIIKRYQANQQTLERIKQRIAIIEAEDKQLAKLLSETAVDATGEYISIQSRKAVEKRNLLIKNL
jgi:adenylate kinase family enzyme